MRHLLLSLVVLAVASPALAQLGPFLLSDTNYPGLQAEVEFVVIDPTTLQVRFRNTSTGNGGLTDASDVLLTTISWDFGSVGFNGDIEITGGSVAVGAFSQSLNFDITDVFGGDDVSGEYGYGNMDGTKALTNFVTATTSEAIPFGGANLDDGPNIDGPQAGLAANPLTMSLGGLGAIQDEVIATLTLSGPITEAQLATDLLNHGIRAEFGSDAAILFIPEPTTLAILGLGGAFLARRRPRPHVRRVP